VPEFRKDPVTGRWVIIAAHRDARPNQFPQRPAVASTTACPFCAETMLTPPMVASYGAHESRPWQVCVVPNLYPILSDGDAFVVAPDATGLYETATSVGMHEVVIEAPTHMTSMSQLTAEQTRLMLAAYRDRMQVMRDTPAIVCAMPIKNVGPDAGASLAHSHSQIVGLPFVPPYVEAELAGAARFLKSHRECVFCSLIREELRADRRTVARTEDFLAWCPFASRFSLEVWIAPRDHQSRFETSDDLLLEKLGRLLQRILRKIESHPRITAYNYYFHSTPFDSDRDDHYHWHIEIIPRIAKAAGVEWGTGVHINSVTPEQAAIELRAQT